jgi:hypothetical protein
MNLNWRNMWKFQLMLIIWQNNYLKILVPYWTPIYLLSLNMNKRLL